MLGLTLTVIISMFGMTGRCFNQELGATVVSWRSSEIEASCALCARSREARGWFVKKAEPSFVIFRFRKEINIFDSSPKHQGLPALIDFIAVGPENRPSEAWYMEFFGRSKQIRRTGRLPV